MAQRTKFSDIFEDRESHKTILKVSIVMLLAMELIIFLVATSQSGSKSQISIYDSKGDKVYETEGNFMTRYEKLVFENTYGPLSAYRVQNETRTIPFPFRAWLAVAVGAPIGFMLLIIYLVRTYLSFVNGGEDENEDDSASLDDNGRRFGQWFKWRRLSLFHFGLFVLVCVLSLWLVPDFVAELTRGAISLVAKYKWFFLGVIVFVASLLVWVIYLKYKISEKMMDRQMDLEKFRVEKQLLLERETRLALPDATIPLKAKAAQGNDGSSEPGDSTQRKLVPDGKSHIGPSSAKASTGYTDRR